MMRPLVYEWPRDKAARQVEDEFLLGDAILVAPLLEENQTAREVYLPEGEWYAFFTGKCYHGCQTISTTADMKFPVFIRGGYAVPLHADGMDSLGNPVSQNLNSKLILLVAGAAGKSTFTTNKSVLPASGKTKRSAWKELEQKPFKFTIFADLQEALAHSKRLFICRQKDLPMNAIYFRFRWCSVPYR